MKSPRIRLLGRVQGLPVYLVDGEAIRNEREIEFTSGGHDLVYPHLVPFREVWIDDAIHGTIDRMATVFHEVIERDLMPLFDRPQWADINHFLVYFGREVCDARKPKCAPPDGEPCPLFDLCPRTGVQ